MASGTADISYYALYDGDILKKIISVLIIVSIFGAIINVIPYFFYDLSELKQQGIIKVLKIRAFFEDFGNNTLSDADLVEVIDMVETANELNGRELADVSKSEIKAAKKTGNKDEINKAKQNRKDALNLNNEINLAPYVVDEMRRFESKLGVLQVEDATRVYNDGLAGIANADLASLKAELFEAKCLPKTTAEEKEIRKYKINFCRTLITSKKYYNKYFKNPSDFVAPNNDKLNEMYNLEESYDALEDKLYKQLFEAKENKNHDQVKELNAQISDLKEKFKALNKQINAEQNSQLSYTRSAKPVLDAQKVLRQAENYAHFDEIKERYDEAKKNLATVAENA
jgi:outer membrane murein-binding lipoprotein Lpp